MRSFLHNIRSRSTTASSSLINLDHMMTTMDTKYTPASCGEQSSCTINSPLFVVELFQSQGCNSCPPTNANLLHATSSATSTLHGAIFLTYHVTYWDYLGWKDTFGDSAFDDRQCDYVRALGLRSAFTPQVIVNGRASGVGNTRAGLEQVLKEGGAGQVAPALKIAVIHDSDDPGHGDEDVVVQISIQDHAAVSGHKLEVSVVRYDPSEVNVAIKSGENRNEVLPHRNVVKSVQRIGSICGNSQDAGISSFRKVDDGLESVVLIQDGVGGSILAAARI